MSFGWVFALNEKSERYIDSFYTNQGGFFLYGVKPEGVERSFVSFSTEGQSWRIGNPEVIDRRSISGGVSLSFPATTVKKYFMPPGTYEVELWLRDNDSTLDVWDLGSAEIVMDNNSGSVWFGAVP